MPLTPEQLQELKGALTKRRAFLEAEAHADAAKAREDVFSQTTGPVADTGDEATADLISDVENAELSRDLQELREIDAALARMAGGSYGTCIDCGGDSDRISDIENNNSPGSPQGMRQLQFGVRFTF